MTRAVSIIAMGVFVFLAACDVGSVLTNKNAPDGGTKLDSGGGGDGAAAACVNNVQPASAHHVHAGGTNAGLACMQAGCHNPGGNQPFTFAGTLYTTAAGTTPKTGATIRVAGTLIAVSDDAGNFRGTATITFPASANATSCPSNTSMVSQLVAGGGNCNNCHKIGAGAQASPLNIP